MLKPHIVVCLTLLKTSDQIVEILLLFIILTHKCAEGSTVVLLLLFVECDQDLLDEVVLNLLLFQELLLLVQLLGILLVCNRWSLTVIYNIIIAHIVVQSHLLLLQLNRMRNRCRSRLELTLMLGMVVLLSLIFNHLFLFFYLLRIYSTVVFAPDYEFLVGLLVE